MVGERFHGQHWRGHTVCVYVNGNLTARPACCRTAVPITGLQFLAGTPVLVSITESSTPLLLTWRSRRSVNTYYVVGGSLSIPPITLPLGTAQGSYDHADWFGEYRSRYLTSTCCVNYQEELRQCCSPSAR